MFNKKQILILTLVFCILCSISAVIASDVNETSDVISNVEEGIMVKSVDSNSTEDIICYDDSGDVLNVSDDESIISKENSDEPSLSASYADVYIDSITTRYNSGKYLYFGWYGYFDGYFKVYKGNSLYYNEYLYGYDDDREWGLEGMVPGTYSAKLVTYNGITLGSSKIVIKKSSSKISVKSFSATAGSTFYCYAYVKDKYTGRNYDGGAVKFKINGKTYKASLKKGVAVAKIKIPSKVKKFTCTATFSGGKNVYSSSTKFKISVKKKPVYKTITISTKLSNYKYVTKNWGKYKIQTFTFKHSFTTLCVFLYKNGKMLKKAQYLSNFQYKKNGVWKWSGWMHGTPAAVYHKYEAIGYPVGNVKVKFKV